MGVRLELLALAPAVYLQHIAHSGPGSFAETVETANGHHTLPGTEAFRAHAHAHARAPELQGTGHFDGTGAAGTGCCW